MKNFLSRFNFDPEKSLFVGVERECFLTDKKGIVVPISPIILKELNDYERFGYELSACQLEERIGPCVIGDLHDLLVKNDTVLKEAENRLGFRRFHSEVGPEDMPLDVYPDPSGRYAEITKNMPREILLAACQVTGTHIHIGMPDHETALGVYNSVIKYMAVLCEKGNGSFGERLWIYKMVAPRWESPPYKDWNDFHDCAVKFGFEKDPRRCWNLIRISVHGTIEFRMFGSTCSFERIVGWAHSCREICAEAMP